VPPLFHQASQADIAPAHWLICEQAVTGVFVTGAAGTGKTHLGVALMRYWLESGIGCYRVPGKYYGAGHRGYDLSAEFWKAPLLMLDLKAGFDGRGPSERDLVQRLGRQVKLLLLDDLGAERQSDWSATIVLAILSERIDYGLHTIVTSNLGLREIAKWEPRIASRLGGMVVIDLGKTDRRLAR